MPYEKHGKAVFQCNTSPEKKYPLITCRVPYSLKDKVEQTAKKKGVKKSVFIRWCLREGVKRARKL